MENTYLDEIECLKKSLIKAMQDNRNTAEVQHAAQVSQLKKQVSIHIQLLAALFTMFIMFITVQEIENL